MSCLKSEVKVDIFQGMYMLYVNSPNVRKLRHVCDMFERLSGRRRVQMPQGALERLYVMLRGITRYRWYLRPGNENVLEHFDNLYSI